MKELFKAIITAYIQEEYNKKLDLIFQGKAEVNPLGLFPILFKLKKRK